MAVAGSAGEEVTLLEQLHASPTGRPQLFRVMRDAALELSDDAAVEETHRAAELWHRAPEEWELERVNLFELIQLSPYPVVRLEQVKLMLEAGWIGLPEAARLLG